MTRTVRQLVIGLLVLVAAAALWLWYRNHPTFWPEYRQAVQVISAVERYKASHGRLPTSIAEASDLPDSENGPVYYEPSGNSGYTVWFGRSLGESYTYDSLSGSWR